MVVYEQHQNMTAIYLFFFRNGFSFGHKEFFPEQDENISPNEAFSQFLMIYYKDRENIPTQILVNKEPADKMLLEQIIKSKISPPTKGPEKEVLDFALDNVNRSLAQRIKKSSTQQAMLENIGKLLGMKQLKQIEEALKKQQLAHPNLESLMMEQLEETLLNIEADTYAEFIRSGRLNQDLPPVLQEIFIEKETISS